MGGILVTLALQVQRADRRLESGELVWTARQRGQAVLSGQAPARLLPASVSMILRARELDPGSIEAVAAAGDLFLLLGREETAQRTYLEALDLEPRPEIYLNLGTIELRLGNEAEARKLFSKATQLDRGLRKTVREILKENRVRKGEEEATGTSSS